MSVITKGDCRLKRRRRVRAKVTGTAERPRISVFRSNQGISAQLIDDDGRAHAPRSTGTGRDLRELGKPDRTKRRGRGSWLSARKRRACPKRCSTAAATAIAPRPRLRRGDRENGIAV